MNKTLNLLENKNISDIGSIDNDEEIFPSNKFDELMEFFDDLVNISKYLKILKLQIHS